MKLFTFLSFIFFTSGLYAQDFSQEYGKIKLQELTFKKYMRDTNAEALMIYDFGKSRFYHDDRGFQILFDRKVKIRILKNSGVRWAQVEIPYYYDDNGIEQVVNIEATSYNVEDGQIKPTELYLKTVYDEKLNEYWRVKKFAIPNVREGSVIEYKYSIRSPYLFNLRDWDFQHKIPTVYSEYTTCMIPFYEYIYILQGKPKFDVYESFVDNGIEQQFGSMKYTDMVYKFGMKDVPAFNDETFITSENDYLWRMDFQLAKIHRPDGSKQEIISTWPKLCNDILKEPTFGKYYNAAEKSARDVLNLPGLASKSKLDQLELIVDFVKSNYSWNGSNSKYANKTLKEFQKEKTGNSANINLYLAGLLKGAGLDASPVLISTRGNGSVYTNYPFLHFFNYVVVLVKIDDKFIITDATDPFCAFNKIPSRCLNNIGLVIKKDSEEWAMLNNPDISKIEKSIYVDLDTDEDSLHFKMQTRFSLYEAYNHKAGFKNDVPEIVKSLNKIGYNSIDSVNTENFNNSKEKYILKFQASAPFERIGDKIYIAPFLNEPLTENPLKQTERTYHVDFIYPFGRTFACEVNIPKGYKVEFLPVPLFINNAMFTVDFKATNLAADKINITGTYIFKKAVYEPADYKNLKYVYNEIIKKFNEKIVLVKI